jgi:hypothetical protein
MRKRIQEDVLRNNETWGSLELASKPEAFRPAGRLLDITA